MVVLVEVTAGMVPMIVKVAEAYAHVVIDGAWDGDGYTDAKDCMGDG